VASLNTLVVSCWWMGRSEFVVSLSDWRGLVYDNLALLAGMAAAISITLMCLKPNVPAETSAARTEEMTMVTKEIMDDIDRADKAKRRAADSSPADCSTCANAAEAWRRCPRCRRNPDLVDWYTPRSNVFWTSTYSAPCGRQRSPLA
jgi:hypothetical protein